jgi:hypothetical protein
LVAARAIATPVVAPAATTWFPGTVAGVGADLICFLLFQKHVYGVVIER